MSLPEDQFLDVWGLPVSDEYIRARIVYLSSTPITFSQLVETQREIESLAEELSRREDN